MVSSGRMLHCDTRSSLPGPMPMRAWQWGGHASAAARAIAFGSTKQRL
jgi:hypothetical protein